MFSLQGKSAVVTGGGSGIGKAVAVTFARQGAIVHIIELSETNAAEAVAEIKKAGGTAQAHACDVSNQQQVADIFKKIGSISILVNNAGISNIGRADTTSEEDFTRVFNVNVKGVYNCLHAAIPLMKAAGGGVVLNMSSIAAQVGLNDRFAYSMSKGAVYAMTLSVAKDYLHDGIRCNCISPARVHTPFVDGFLAKNYPGKEAEMFEKLSKSQPIGRMGTPEEVATLILYLCSGEASFITGCDYPIDGGFLKLSS
jgi:NAD(P)-dependent dehydrogenase (short-subunit alcohol dehydrogenase family)